MYRGKIVTLFLAYLFLDSYSLVFGGQYGFISFSVRQVDITITQASNILGYLLIGLVLISGKKLPRLVALDYCIILFFLWASASTLWAVDISIASFNAFRFFQFIILYLLTRILIRTKLEIELYFRYVLICFIPLFLLVLLQYFAGFFGTGYGEGRPGTLVSFIPYLLAFTALISRGKWLIWGSILLSIYLASFHGSRRTFLAIMGYFGLHFRLKKSFFVIIGILLLFGPYLYGLIPDTTRSRLDNTFTLTQTLFEKGDKYETLNRLGSNRWEYWDYSIQMFMDNPILGVGLKNQVGQLDDYGAAREVRAHNFYIEILADLGIVGIIFLFAIIYNGMKGLNNIRFSNSGEKLFLYHMVKAYKYEFIMIHIVAIFGSSMFYNKSAWILYGLIASIASLNKYTVENKSISANFPKQELIKANKS